VLARLDAACQAHRLANKWVIVPTLPVVTLFMTLRVTGTRSVLGCIPTRSAGTIVNMIHCRRQLVGEA
jgi:hypothetical protein